MSTMTTIHIYNLLKQLEARSSESSYHMPGGGAFRNQFINLQVDQKYGPFTSNDAMVITCLSGKMRLEIQNKNLLTIWRPEGLEQNQRETLITSFDQVVLDEGCFVMITAESTGTIQILGTPKNAGQDK